VSVREREGEKGRKREGSERLVDMDGFLGSSVFSFFTHNEKTLTLTQSGLVSHSHPTLSIHP